MRTVPGDAGVVRLALVDAGLALAVTLMAGLLIGAQLGMRDTRARVTACLTERSVEVRVMACPRWLTEAVTP